MSTTLDRCKGILNWFQNGPAKYPTALAVPSARMVEAFTPPALTRDDSYFAVRLNQMRLSSGRRWWEHIMPMAFVLSEFDYNGQRTAVPFVVGPSLLEKYGRPVPDGMLFEDTLVAGLHPYKGGRIAITVILYALPTTNEARQLLSMVEGATAIFSAATNLTAYLKVADVVLDGVEGLLGIGDVEPIAGRRHEIDPDLDTDLGTGYFVLSEAELNVDQIWVESRRLRTRGAPTAPLEDVSGTDYMLYSLGTTQTRTDIEQLSFHRTIREAEKLANVDASSDGWKRAKAMMTTGFTEIIDSPDLSRVQGDQLRASYRERLLSLHAEAEANANMAGEVGSGRRAAALADATLILDL
jgi:hypothetical protein